MGGFGLERKAGRVPLPIGIAIGIAIAIGIDIDFGIFSDVLSTSFHFNRRRKVRSISGMDGLFLWHWRAPQRGRIPCLSPDRDEYRNRYRGRYRYFVGV